MSSSKKQTIRFKHPNLRRLRSADRDRSIASLHFTNRAIHLLEREGIFNLGDLVRSAEVGFRLNVGYTSHSYRSVTSALRVLSDSVDSNGAADFLQYAASHGYKILPVDNSPSEFLSSLPDTIRSAVRCRFSNFYLAVFDRYIMARSFASAREVASELKCSKQNVGLANVSIFRMLREAIFNGHYIGAEFRFRQEFADIFSCLKRRLDAQRDVFYESELHATVFAGLPFTISPDEPRGRLLLAILGYTSVYYLGKQQSRLIVRVRGRPILPALSRATLRVHSLLRTRFPAGLTKERILTELSKAGEAPRTVRSLSLLFKSIPDIEVPARGPKIVISRLPQLTRMTDQLERILRMHGKPMHGRELAVEISRCEGRAGSKRTSSNLRHAMSQDLRFKPVGRSGLWTLAEWEVERRSILDIAVEILSRSKNPITERELYSSIAAVRPLARRSLASMLRKGYPFLRVRPGLWRLKQEGLVAETE